MKCVILQPSYIPWRGYFHQIQKADLFVYYDDVQYDKNGWRNRNRILGPNGPMWLTIPAKVKGFPLIQDVEIDEKVHWQKKHWRSFENSYSKAPHFAEVSELLLPFYEEPAPRLADFTIATTTAISDWLGLNTRFIRSSAIESNGTKTDRLVEILTAIGATHYISGPAAKDYLEEGKLEAAGISLEYMSYDYPDYPQLHGHNEQALSILDLIFMVGRDVGPYIWEHRDSTTKVCHDA
uniref:WbqC-like protein family protein n=1 Tax=Bremerella volcania TaxID=2527984 RepID=A0A518C869_9BACT|nr:WbqC family protein [Bremerella volcania]QDU75404.1 WbqC-like protein family protein [Bremerella volcania]